MTRTRSQCILTGLAIIEIDKVIEEIGENLMYYKLAHRPFLIAPPTGRTVFMSLTITSDGLCCPIGQLPGGILLCAICSNKPLHYTAGLYAHTLV